MFQLYNRHFGRIPVVVTGNAPVPPPKYPAGGDQPKINTGSATWPLDVSAALTADRKELVVAVVNATEEARTLDLAVQGFQATAQGHSFKLTGANVDAVNAVGKPPQVAITEAGFDATAKSLPVPPISIALYKFGSA